MVLIRKKVLETLNNMKELTRTDVFNAITKAIEIIETGYNLYMCNALELAFDNDKYLGIHIENIKIHKHIPELITYKPNDKAKSGAWFPIDKSGKAMRIKILTELQEIYSK